MPSERKIAACVIASIGTSLAASPAPPIQVTAGTIHGTTCDSTTTWVYRGISFAAPPVDKLRFMAPQPPNTTFPGRYLNATQSSPACIQIPSLFAWTEPSTSEDCLYLDVYVPPGNHSDLPIKVWAYGGFNTGGSTSYPFYDLCNMATDSIAVAFNYRLGPLGFLGLDAAGIEGNMGIKDYVAALEWVQPNIESFGGDPTKVLLFGESSGGDDSFIVSTLPQAKSLVRSVIYESGGGFDLPTYDNVQRVGADYASVLNCSTSDLQCLQSKSADELVSAYLNAPSLYQGPGTFSNPDLSLWAVILPNANTLYTPFVDGHFIAQQPYIVGPQVPIVIGSNADDGTLTSLPPLFLSGGPITANNYTTYLSQFGTAASEVSKRYPLSAFNSSGSTEYAVGAAITKISTTATFICTKYRALRSAVNAGTPAYTYIFNHTMSCPLLWFDGTPFPSNETSSIFGATHASELPLVFGNLDNQPWGNGTCNASQVERDLSTSLRSAWTAMAASGNPSTQDLTWPRFGCSGEGIVIEDAIAVDRPDFSECEFWDQVWRERGGVDLRRSVNRTCQNNDSIIAGGNSQAYTGAASKLQSITFGGISIVVLGIAFALFCML